MVNVATSATLVSLAFTAECYGTIYSKRTRQVCVAGVCCSVNGCSVLHSPMNARVCCSQCPETKDPCVSSPMNARVCCSQCPETKDPCVSSPMNARVCCSVNVTALLSTARGQDRWCHVSSIRLFRVCYGYCGT